MFRERAGRSARIAAWSRYLGEGAGTKGILFSDDEREVWFSDTRCEREKEVGAAFGTDFLLLDTCDSLMLSINAKMFNIFFLH